MVHPRRKGGVAPLASAVLVSPKTTSRLTPAFAPQRSPVVADTPRMLAITAKPLRAIVENATAAESDLAEFSFLARLFSGQAVHDRHHI